MIEIDGFWWFVGALLICGAHALYLRGCRRARQADLAWRQAYDAAASKQHEEFMAAMAAISADDWNGWNLDGSRERGQA